MSSEQTYKQLHQIKCGQFSAVSRASLVDSSVHGYIASASEGVLLLYNVPKYVEATRSCNLRKDKCLPSHSADVQILVTEPLSWVSFNSEGLVLGVLTSSSVRGTFISFVPLTEALKCGSVELKSVGRSVRVCGGEQVTADGRAGWELRDFAWSPVAPTVFAIVLQSGSVRVYDVPPVSPSPYTLTAHLQSTVDAHCLCWSPKGKQLAVCINGHINTANGIVKGPMILQTDPHLHLKRVIQLADVFSGTPTTPLDLLWTSPYCFVLGFHSASSNGRSKGSMGAILLHAPAKSEEVHHLEIPELRNRPDSDHFQYYLRAMGSSHFVGTHSAGGEEMIIFRLPPSSALTAPIALASVELPPDGSPLGMCLGFYRPDCNSDDLTAYLVTRLTSGTISPYLLDPSELLASLHLTLPPRIDLPIPTPVDAMKSVSATLQTGPAVPSSQPVPHSVEQTRSSIQQPQDELAHTAYQKPEMAFGSAGQTGASPGPSHTSTAIVTSELAVKPSSPAKLTKPATAAVPSLGSASQGEATSAGDAEQKKVTTVAASGDSTTFSGAKPIDEPSMVVHLPESVHTAATQFSAALQTEFDTGRDAWSALFQILREGPHRGDTGGGDTCAQGVDVIEARLHDSEAFLRALSTVTGELKTAAKERRDDLSASVAYAEKVRWALRLYANGDSTEIMTENLDPEAGRLLNQLKRRSRLVESGLYDLETQLEALSADIDGSCSQCPAGKRVIKDKSKPDPNIIQTFNIVSQLIRSEHSRIDYITECLKRLRLSDLTQGSSPLQSRKDVSLRSTQSWSVSKLSDSQNLEFTPAWNSLLQRDRALFRLFSKHKLPTVHAPSICPTVTTEAKKPDLSGVNGNKDLAASGDSANTRTPTTVKNSLHHPQQMNLEKLLNLSGEAAITNSPPAKNTLFPRASSIHSSTPASVASLYGHMKAEIPNPMTITPKSDTLPIPQLTSHQPFGMSSALSTASSGLSHVSKPAASLIASPSTTSIGSQSPNLSPSLGTFVLGQKLAHTLPTSPVILAQQRTPGSSSVASSQPSSTPQQTVAQSPSTTPLSAFPKPSAPAQLPQDQNALTFAPTPSAKVESSKSLGSTAGFELSKLQSLLLEPQSLVTPSSTSPFTTASPASPPPAPTLAATNSPPPVSTTSASATLATPFSFFSTPISGSGKLFGSAVTLGTTESAALNSPGSSAATTVTASSTTGSSPLVTTCGKNSAITSSSPPTQKKDVSSFGVSGTSIVSPSSNVATSVAPVVGLFSGSGQPSRTSTDSTTVTTTAGKPLFGGITLGGPFGNSGFKLQPAASTPSTAQVGGLFGTTTTTPSTSGYVGGGLFASATNTTFSAPATTAGVGLFGSFASQPPTVTTVSTDGGLFQFAHTTTTTSGSGGGIFGSTMAAPTTASSVFGHSAAGQNANVGSAGLFGFGTPTTIPQNVTVSTTASLSSGGGLFASLSSQQSSGGGLFGSPATSASSREVNSLFSNANFGLGTNSQPPQNVFGRPVGSSAFGGQGLFGTPTTTKTDIFGASVFGAAVKNAPTTVSGGLFSSSMTSKFGGGTASAASGGLFGSPHSQSAGGFGSGPVFGGSAFSSSGGQAFGMAGVAAFGASSGGLFGGIASSPPAGAGGGLFGVASPTTPAVGSGGGGGLFAALAAKTESPTFGSLAHNSPQMAVTPPSPFGSSPSFTQRRA